MGRHLRWRRQPLPYCTFRLFGQGAAVVTGARLRLVGTPVGYGINEATDSGGLRLNF